jgi:hypothetical protein
VKRFVVLLFEQLEYSFFVVDGGWLIINEAEKVFFLI